MCCCTFCGSDQSSQPPASSDLVTGANKMLCTCKSLLVCTEHLLGKLTFTKVCLSAGTTGAGLGTVARGGLIAHQLTRQRMSQRQQMPGAVPVPCWRCHGQAGSAC